MRVQAAGAGPSRIRAVRDVPAVLTQVTGTTVPGGHPATIAVSASGDWTWWPSAMVITSPAVIPADAAPVPHRTPTTSAPAGAGAIVAGVVTSPRVGTQPGDDGGYFPPRALADRQVGPTGLRDWVFIYE